MDFSLTEEQTLLQESVDRFIQNDYEFDKRQSFANSELGFSEDNWKMFADLGWLGIPFSEADGGFGGGPVDSMLIWEQFGKGLVIEPFLATVILGGGVLRLAGNADQKAAYLPGIIDGSMHAALARLNTQNDQLIRQLQEVSYSGFLFIFRTFFFPRFCCCSLASPPA